MTYADHFPIVSQVYYCLDLLVTDETVRGVPDGIYRVPAGVEPDSGTGDCAPADVVYGAGLIALAIHIDALVRIRLSRARAEKRAA